MVIGTLRLSSILQDALTYGYYALYPTHEYMWFLVHATNYPTRKNCTYVATYLNINGSM